MFRAKIAAAHAIEALARDFELRQQLPDLHEAPEEFITYDGRGRRTNMATALERLPTLVTEVPTYNLNARRLRHAAENLATPATIAEFVASEIARDARLLRRVHRVRNCLTHGGPWHNTMIESASTFITNQAKHITGVTLRAFLDGKPATNMLRKYRGDNAAWIAGLAGSADNTAALFPGIADAAT